MPVFFFAGHVSALDRARVFIYLAHIKTSDMNILGKFFKCKQKQAPQPLRIEGVAPAPMTPEPDDAELAAMAVLEKMSEGRTDVTHKKDDKEPDRLTKRYYHALADRIRAAHADAALRTMRFLAYCEQQLQLPSLPKDGPGSLALIEAELYKRIDTVEREGGSLKERWQHCLALTILRRTGQTQDVPDSKPEERE